MDDGTVSKTEEEKPITPTQGILDDMFFAGGEGLEGAGEGDETIVRNFTYDNQIIKEFFDELQENSDNVFLPEEVNDFGDMYYTIICSSEKVPSGSYHLYLEYYSGLLVCGNEIDGYVEVSLEVIEKLAGQEIDLDALITGR